MKALARLGILDRFDGATSCPFGGIRFIQEDGSSAQSTMLSNGMGIRRTVLVGMLARRAEELGVAAGGLHSSMRKASRLDAKSGARRRFALRQHHEVRPGPISSRST